MFESFLGAFIIMLMRICDVSLATFRTILIVQSRKYLAGLVGFFEVLIWIIAIRLIFQHLDNVYNIIGYSVGFALGNIIGITIEQKIGLGYVQLSIISKFKTDEIANALRRMKNGVTILPAEGGAGGVAIIIVVVPRNRQSIIIDKIESIDKEAFITIQSASPYRGYFITARK
ncbi:MAG: hypothetical protein C0425_01040 [Chlorobiaceae bacterium]|nr:hypothetical protein [Chlorobiaceae bacterium]MBA4308906.1 hypothetical protein [Chlorobiaceae bacterium]